MTFNELLFIISIKKQLRITFRLTQNGLDQMKYLRVLFLFLLASNSFAQSPKDQLNFEGLKKELIIIANQNQKLIRELDSIKVELGINRALIDADQKRAMDTLEYASKIIDWSAWIFSIMGILFVSIGFIVGYFGFREIRSFQNVRKNMNKSFKMLQKEIIEISNTSKNLTNIIYWSNEGLTKYLNGNYEGAEFLFKKIKELKRDDYQTCLRLGRVYSAMRRYDDAKNEFEQAVFINPKEGDAYFGLGWNYMNQEKYNEAIDMYKKGLKFDFGFYGLCGLGHTYMKASNYTAAKECFIKSIKDRPNSGSSFPLANIFLFESNNKLANEYYEGTIEYTNKEMNLEPDNF